MTDPTPDAVFNEETVAAFAVHLEEFAHTLSVREQRALWRLLVSVMDPWDRMRLRDPADLLSPREEEFLSKLEAEGKGTETR